MVIGILLSDNIKLSSKKWIKNVWTQKSYKSLAGSETVIMKTEITARKNVCKIKFDYTIVEKVDFGHMINLTFVVVCLFIFFIIVVVIIISLRNDDDQTILPV